jgi:integrase
VEDLAADDFAALRATMAKKWGPVRVGNSITRAKSIFKFGYETQLMERPARYGPEFVKPDKAKLRKHHASKPARQFSVEEVCALIDGALVVGEYGPKLVKPDAALRAMILLGVNCGFGNGDCAELNLSAVDLTNGWANFPRPKTGIARRGPLWPETVEAIQAAGAVRPKPQDLPDCGRVFLTTRGSAFIVITTTKENRNGVEMIKSSHRKDLIGIQFGKLLDALGFRRQDVGFYSLRHVFETIAGGSKDQVDDANRCRRARVAHSFTEGAGREGRQQDNTPAYAPLRRFTRMRCETQGATAASPSPVSQRKAARARVLGGRSCNGQG